ncbi:MAG: glycoside hydrolase family 2 TIM barrel-domain containing protein [Candidatus Methylacidiphilales bacterium]|nr:glycoside hydrolase family 2 TIM barrel-domain containing protein [Candidatus Methylacidiphilales bacterium]
MSGCVKKEPAPNVPPLSLRMPEKPAWEVTLTPHLEWLGDSLDSLEAARRAPGMPYAQAMSRRARETRLDHQGRSVWWRVQVTLPPEAATGEPWPAVLDADEARVIAGAWIDGQPFAGFEGKDQSGRIVSGEGSVALPGFDTRERGSLWSSGEGSLLLPLTPGRISGEVLLKSQDMPHLYENGFGQLRLRPATLDELIRLERAEKGSVRVTNRGPLPMVITLHVRHEDYFGVALVVNDLPLTLAPGASTVIPAGQPEPDKSTDLYKTRFWASVGSRKTLEYWDIQDAARDERVRPQVLRLERGWEFCFVPGPHAQHPAPASAAQWKPATIPHRIPDDTYSSHWMWYRTRFTVPANWKEQRIQLMLPSRILLQSRVVLDGQLVGEFPNWELPKMILLPGTFTPGSTHELMIGVTDYIVALAPGITPPAGGPMNPPGRGLIAPIASTTRLEIGMQNIPELISVPAVRTDQATVRTTLSGGRPQIEAKLKLNNNSSQDGTYTVEASVLEKGTPVFRFPTLTVAVPAGKTVPVDLKRDWNDPKPRLWTLEDPWLYELRTEIKDATGVVLDTRRERFGFREFGIKDDHFTLNGHRVNLLGGSHVVLQSLTWPVRHQPFIFLRHFGNHQPSGFLTGRAVLHLADEMGYLVKNENSNLNAHHMDNYAWQDPLLWERATSQMQALIDAQGNHPSIAVWDIGNEIIFKGPGESQMMADQLARIRSMDPSRVPTVGGSAPFPPGAIALDMHGWGSWSNRSDYLFYHPEERPSYLRKSGFYSHRPAQDPEKDWSVDLKNMGESSLVRPNDNNKLHHIEGKPVIFSEGHYYESQLPIPLLGHLAYLRLKREGTEQGLDRYLSYHGLNLLATRTLSIQNVRDAGFASSMIHVDRGIGRFILPLVSFSHDRRTRFSSGEKFQSRYGIFYDLSNPGEVHARYRLFDGETLLGEKSFTQLCQPGSRNYVDLEFPLPRVEEDRRLRLEVRLSMEATGRWFYDDVPITVYATDRLALPAGQSLALYDPQGGAAAFLRAHNIPFTTLKKLADWEVAPDGFLLIGSEGLNRCGDEDRAGLGKKIEAGGRVIVLDHRSLPRFLARPLAQTSQLLNMVARLEGPSVLTRGLLNEDLRFWHSRERDQLVSWGALEIPATGRFRVHLTSGNGSPLLELQEGKGRVVFVQLNLQDTLGLEPASTRLMANLLQWSGEPSVFPDKKTLLVSSNNMLVSPLQNRLGLNTPVKPVLSAEDAATAELVVVSGTEATSRAGALGSHTGLARLFDRGGTLFVYGLDAAGARWLSEIAGTELKLEPVASRGALLRGGNPLTAGLGHGDFFPSGFGDGFDVDAPFTVKPGDNTLALARLSGSSVRALTQPGVLSEIPVGRGRIVVLLVQSLEYPVPALIRILSTVLSNIGAPLNPGGAAEADTTVWAFDPVDLGRHVNWPLSDNDGPNQRRGWHLGGSDNDMRSLPSGRQNFRGIEYLLTDPTSAKGNGAIGISGANPKIPELPREVKGIPVNRKAERLYFLHNSAWGIPEFVYRVYYLEERRAWIPGKPDPFVDVVVKPKENIHDWWFGSAVDNGSMFLPGATVAWLGDNPTTRRGSTRFGVYQMIWDNPHPDKTIESIDILSTGRPGEGNAYILAITAASRATGDATPAKPPLKKVLPAGVKTSDVQEQIQFKRYGAVLLKDGGLASVYDDQGRVFATSRGWSVQGSAPRPGQKPVYEDLGRQEGQQPTLTSSVEGTRRTYVITGKEGASGPLKWQGRLTATPGGLRYELNFTPLRGTTLEGGDARVHFGLGWLNGAKADNSKPNENPLRITTPAGLATLSFDSRYRYWFQSYAVYPEFVTFYAPPHNAAPYTLGQEESVWWELTVP